MERFNELLVQYKYPLLMGLVASVLMFSGSIASVFSSPVKEQKEFPKESLAEQPAFSSIKVDIAGAVQKPGVYELKKDTRLEELITEAGGFRENVNKEYVSKSLNLSQKVSDSQKIYIPFQGEKTTIPAGAGTSVTAATNGKISLNNATQSQLEELPGVGPSTSSKLVAGRPYVSIQELLTKKIVGKATFEKLKNLIEL